jgi:hypothetical protein
MLGMNIATDGVNEKVERESKEGCAGARAGRLDRAVQIVRRTSHNPPAGAIRSCIMHFVHRALHATFSRKSCKTLHRPQLLHAGCFRSQSPKKCFTKGFILFHA